MWQFYSYKSYLTIRLTKVHPLKSIRKFEGYYLPIQILSLYLLEAVQSINTE